MSDPIRNRNLKDLTFTTGLLHVRTSFESTFSGCDHLSVSCKFILPFHSSMPSPVSRSCFGTNWDPLLTVLHTCNWDSFFITSELHVATGILHSILPEFLYSITPARTYSTLTKTNCHDRLSCKVAKLQTVFLRTRDFLFVCDTMACQNK